jgi:hypothetical protein
MIASVAVKDRKRDRETVPGSWVRAARRVAGLRDGARPLSQMRLAVLVRRDRNTITRWEADDGEVDFVVWLGVLHALRLPVEWEPAESDLAAAHPDTDEPES